MSTPQPIRSAPDEPDRPQTPSVDCDPTHLERLDALCGSRLDRQRVLEALIDLAREDETLHARVMERASRTQHPELQPLFDHLTRD